MDPSLALLDDTSELVGNSVHRQTITDKKDTETSPIFLGEKGVSLKIKRRSFVSLEELDDNFLQIIFHKTG